MAKNLVIVESPTKAKTIKKFLGKDFVVESSFGHIRDLPKSKMGVDVEHDYAPSYIVPRANMKRVTALKKLAKAASHIYYATDEDREGEAISWHLHEVLEAQEKETDRIAFHEITEEAIKNALAHPRKIDMNMVDAQQARRIVDRLVGYELSPFLWRKVTKGLSAGRVQSVVVRLIVEREREIEAFIPQEYWSIELTTQRTIGEHEQLISRIYKCGDTVLDKFALKDKKESDDLVENLQKATYSISDVAVKEVKKTAPVPYTTSTLQQDAHRRLHLSAKQTMMLAQQLYEEGYITYMRTDSVNLAEKFLTEAKGYISQKYGANYAVGPRIYKTKSKLAQEAHEAIRPTSSDIESPELRGKLTEAHAKLYTLIWQRAIASQMPDARYEATTIDIRAEGTAEYTFRTTGQTMIFPGFTAAYDIESEETLLPKVSEGEALDFVELKPEQHFTKPPARYSEATLVKTLEENGIGRPSTYAPTISTVIERNYVQREEGRLKPTEIAFLVNDLLVKHFPDIVDPEFTARMEDSLDEIAEGKKDWVPVIDAFYKPFKENLKIKEGELSKKDIVTETTDEICEKCGKPMAIKFGRFGKFLACTGFPECKNARPIVAPGAEGESTPDVEPCEKCSKPMVMKQGRFGKFLGCSGYPECKNIRSLTDKKLDIACPECGKGMIIQKISKRKKAFYSCTKYPDCAYISWTKPGAPE